MTKIKLDKVGLALEEGAEQGDREALWKEYLANYKAKNPVKFATKEARGEFKVPPVSFKGIVKVVKLPSGSLRKEIY